MFITRLHVNLFSGLPFTAMGDPGKLEPISSQNGEGLALSGEPSQRRNWPLNTCQTSMERNYKSHSLHKAMLKAMPKYKDE